MLNVYISEEMNPLTNPWKVTSCKLREIQHYNPTTTEHPQGRTIKKQLLERQHHI